LSNNSSSLNETPLPGRKLLVLSVALVIVLPYLCLIPYAKFFGFDTSDIAVRTTSFWISRFLLWLLLGGFFLYAVRIEKSKLLLWQEKKYPAWAYLVFAAVTFFTVFLSAAIASLILRLLNLINENAAWDRIGVLFQDNYVLLIFTCVTAGVTEELLFRGFLQPRLELLFKNRWAAIIVTALFFAFIHFGFGTVQNIVGPFIIGTIFSIHYSYFRNIKFLIVFHILWDLLALLLVIYLHEHQITQ
jgi:uncharacterized protein